MREEGTVIVMTDEQVKGEIESSQKMWEGFMKPPHYISYPNGRITPVVPPGNVVTVTGTNTVTSGDWTDHSFRIWITASEMKEIQSRKEFRRLLGDRLNNIYQTMLARWEQAHPEATE